MRASPTVFAPDQKPWYRRTWALAALGVVALTIVVVTDFPRSTNPTDRSSQYILVQTQVWSDIQSCDAGLASSITAVGEILDHRSTDVATANEIATQAEPNCTPVGNSDLLDLASINVPNILENYQVKYAITDLNTWAFPNAAAIINDLRGLLINPNNATLTADIVSRQKTMDALVADAQRILNTDAAIFHVPTKTFSLTTINTYPTSILPK